MTTQWPLLLAGPIVRRVEPKLAAIWVALKAPCTVELTLWKGKAKSKSAAGTLFEIDDSDATANTTPFATQTTESIRVGQNLHIALVSWEGNDDKQLEDGTLYAYNIKLIPRSGQPADLNSLRLLKTDSTSQQPVLALGYDEGFLPSFVTPPSDLLKLKLAHGSCRKPFGAGDDALAFLDKLIEQSHQTDQVANRPQQLVLTGDQIYADEVADMMLPALNAVGQELIGTDSEGQPHEHLLMPVSGTAQQFWPADMLHFPAARRQRLTQVAARFTSTGARSHLLSLGEFCAMYLFVWSNVLWPETLPSQAEVYPAAMENPPATHKLLTPLEQLAGAKADYDQQKQSTEAFRQDLPQVRRALANIATYMIMDDHEVTDDWYLTEQWRHLVLQTGLGRYVIGNGLIAYGLFQGWGNDPKQFQDGKNKDFLTQVQALYPTPATPPQETDKRHAALQKLLGMVNEPTQTPDDFVRWYYAIEGPKHQIIVLDTRNWRSGRSLYSPPDLIEKNLLARQITATSRPQGKDVTFVVSAVPVLGLPTIEEVLQPTLNRYYDVKRAQQMRALEDTPDPQAPDLRERELIGAAKKDPEPWSFDPYALERLLERLVGHERVIFLSGDVHYALSAALDYWQKTSDDLKPKARFVQLTASALKNVEGSLIAIASSPAAQAVFDKLEAPLARLVWNEADPAPVNAPAGERLPAQYRLRLQESPVLVGPGGWPEKTVLQRPPDRAWRFRLVHDGRPDSDRPEPIRHVAVGPDQNPQAESKDERFNAYAKALTRHQEALLRSDPRLVFFDSNLGVVSLTQQDTLTLTQASLEQLKAKDELPAAVVEGLQGLQDRPILEANFRSVLKAHLGLHHALSKAQMDLIQATATRQEDVLTVQHQLHANHSQDRSKAAVYMQHLIDLGLTTEAPPTVIGSVPSDDSA